MSALQWRGEGAWELPLQAEGSCFGGRWSHAAGAHAAFCLESCFLVACVLESLPPPARVHMQAVGEFY